MAPFDADSSGCDDRRPRRPRGWSVVAVEPGRGGHVDFRAEADRRRLVGGVELEHDSLTGAQHPKHGALQRGWTLGTYRTKQPAKAKPTVAGLSVIGGDDEAKGWDRFQAVYAGIALARELVTEPPNVIHPQGFVERCRPLADLGVSIEVLDGDEMAELGMGALLGVSQGSAQPPKLLVMRWDGTDGAQEKPVSVSPTLRRFSGRLILLLYVCDGYSVGFIGE